MIITNSIIIKFFNELKNYLGDVIPVVDKANNEKCSFIHNWNHSNIVDFSRIHTKKEYDNAMNMVKLQLTKPVVLSY